MAVLLLSLVGLLGLLVAPAAVLAGTPGASPSPSPGPSPTTSPVANPTQPGPSHSPAPSPSPTNTGLLNRQPQGQLIADLTASEAHALMLEKSLNQSELSLIALGQQIVDAEKQVASLDSRITAVSALHEQVSTRLQADRTQLATIIRRLYKHQDNFFASLIRSGGFGGLLETLGYSDVVLDRERSLIRAVQADDVALAHAQATLERSRHAKKDTLSRLVIVRTTLAQEIASEQSLQTQLQGTIDEALVALDAMQTDSPDMAVRRAKLVKMKTDSVLSQIEQAVFAQQDFQQAAQLIAEDPVLASTGRLLWPIPHATITQGFGPTPYVFEASYAGFPHFHTGIDLAVPLGTPVFAAADGVVMLARPMADSTGTLVGYGNYVIIQHDAGLKTLYGHLLTIGVKEGDLVHRGQLVGLVGSTGNSTGPHTHFEVRIENSPVDPMQLLPDLAPQPAAPIPASR
ncbi:MAG TPA: M23 family metallopeptidase [Candidatus Dormibacteraeota bacterium]|nr:M23 family metallopeptidase [Candidatus Dormibacteraeota bacterium]